MEKKKRRRRDIGHNMVRGSRRRVGGIGSGADDVDKINIGHWFRLDVVCGRQERAWGGWRGRRQDRRKRV